MKQNRVKKRLNSCDKFTFSIEFQLEVLRFLVQGKEALLYVTKIKPGYFTLIEHSIVVEALVKFVKKYQRIPSEVLMVEQVKTLLEGKDYVDLVTKDDIPNIHSLISELYNKPLKDVDIVLENIHKFIAYIELKALNEGMDFSDYNSYETYQAKLTKILQSSKPQKKDEPLLMVSGTAMRQLMRKVDPDVVPTPFWQLNRLGNGDGYPKNSLFVLIDRPKRRKTFALINVARGYLAMKILAFETSAKAASAAVMADGKLLAECYQNTGLTHSQTLMVMAQDLLKQLNLTAKDMDAVAVAAGPGSFTGVRIGVAAAKGFAWGREIPCVGTSTLESMALGLGAWQGYVCPVMDARRSQVYNGLFHVSGGNYARVQEDRAISLADLGEELKILREPIFLVGDGSNLCYNTLLEKVPGLVLPPEHRMHQRAAGVALAAERMLQEGGDFSGAALMPNYLRLSQAERERLERENSK